MNLISTFNKEHASHQPTHYLTSDGGLHHPNDYINSKEDIESEDASTRGRPLNKFLSHPATSQPSEAFKASNGQSTDEHIIANAAAMERGFRTTLPPNK